MKMLKRKIIKNLVEWKENHQNNNNKDISFIYIIKINHFRITYFHSQYCNKGFRPSVCHIERSNSLHT